MGKKSLQKEYMDKDIAHGFHGLTVPSTFHQSGSLMYEKASGVWIWDVKGKKYLEGLSIGLCTNVGSGREELAEAAKSQMIRLHHMPDFGGRANIPAIELYSKLAELAPGKVNRFQVCSSGSDAVEAAIKIARFYQREKGRDKYKIISLDKSYHGTTLGTMSASGLSSWKSPSFEPYVPGFIHIVTPYCYRCPLGKSYPGCDIDCAHSLEETIEKEGEDIVGAFLIEPILSSGGVIVPPPEYWQKVTPICKKHNVLLIIDEVITGFGRTGKFWGCDHWGIQPDIMTISKGLCSGYLPTSGTGITEEVYKGITEHDIPLAHANTFGGHATTCAVALKNIEIIIRENLVNNSAKVGEYARKRLAAFKERCPYVGDVRGLGLLFAIELVPNKDKKEFFDPEKARQVGRQVVSRCYERGVIVVSFGNEIIQFGPPLIITQDEMDILLDTLEWAIEGIQV